MADCATEDQIERFCRGDLNSSDLTRLHEHARSCPACQSRITAAQDTVTMLEDIRTVMDRRQRGPAAALSGTLEGATFGGYTIGAVLGEGGMARVYRAEHTTTGDPAALKVLKPELMASEDICARFEREARAMTRIAHPNVVTVFECPRDHDTTAIAMELLDGGTLRDWADRRQGAWTRSDFNDVVGFALQAARGLAAAHEIGLVHRDIKPANLLFASDGALKIVDFGVAQALESATWVTGLGHHIGTPAYMSPEQCRGERASKASDIYSLGVTLYELLTAKLPFEVDGGSPFAQMLK
ncbi:MAG: serine/threonine protein kinase, partial [bacterium]|nr:serine/threonine protein kinase [bacterium]